MLIKGEKYACEACVRGHRVSSCTHSDRKLLHVNKKGRPVSQCQHCRSLRKARSQHVKCDCQDKAHAKEDCPHLKPETSAGNAIEANTCCCGHGARCTCSLKKEVSLDTVLEDYPQVIQPKDAHKSRISSLNSHESKTTIFVNGHHKPVHKINDAHNHCGAPYRKPTRSHTVHGHREFGQRSTDSLPLLKQAPRPTESPLHTVTNAPEQVRKVKSEHNSPELGPIAPNVSVAMQDFFIPPLSPNAYSYSPFDTQNPGMLPTSSYNLDLPETIPDSWFMTYDEAHKNDYVPCADPNESPPVDWSQYGFCANAQDAFPLAANGFTSNPMMPYNSSFDNMNFSSYPRMNSSSGEISETDERSSTNRPSNLRTVSNASNDMSTPGDDVSDNHRLSTASSYHGTPQANALAGNLGNLDIDEFVAQTVAEQRRLNMQRPQASHSTPPLQQSQTSPPPQQTIQSPQIPRSSGTPPVQPNTQSPPMQPLPQFQQMPRQSSMGSALDDLNAGLASAQSPFGSEHPFTVHEAQAYAHMNENRSMTPQREYSDSPIPTTFTEDPMWSVPMGAFKFKLDDPGEDEDWVR